MRDVTSESNDARGLAAEDLHDQITEHRRELARTVSALRDKTDVKAQLRDRAAGAEIAVAGLAHRVGRAVDAVPRFLRWGAARAGDQAQRLPEPVRGPAEHTADAVRRRIRALVAGWTALVAVLALLVMRRRHHG